mgnify:CR=1 FL=1
MRRKFMSMALTAAMVISMAATPVFAEDTACLLYTSDAADD